MNELKRRLIRRIQTEGPISVADYMSACLIDPKHGYYTRFDPLGRAGDFITAPEISQMFGELLGLWCAETWERLLGRPAPVNLIELGPGRGTLMADALRAIRAAPAFHAAIRVHLVEMSPALREKQRAALPGVDVTWHDAFDDAPEGPFLLLANEFFDALPIRQLVRANRGWAERMVGVDMSGEELRFGVAPGPSPWAETIPDSARDAPPGSLIEISPACVAVAQSIARRIARHGGAALIVDYASDSALGETLQAVRRHGRHEVLDDPGEADLSARVDFGAIAAAARGAGCASFGPVPQREFLERLGIAQRAERLSLAADPRQAAEIQASLRRLIDSVEMGTLFKVLALAPRDSAAPAGF